MSWREELRPASFRGVPFEVEGDSGTFGRRTQVHEYPQRDKPWTEDLGRATRSFEITAFVVGDDYLQRRDALLAALETEGSGLLIHPWYGELTVNVKDPARVSHSNRGGGMCSLAISFVEAGELEFPAASNSLGAQSLMAADDLGEAVAEDFADSFVLDDMPSFVQDAFEADLGLFSDMLDAASSGWQWLNASVPEWLGDALDFGRGIVAMFDRFVLPLTASNSARLNRNAVISLTALSRQYGGYVVASSAVAPATRQRDENRAALAELFQQATLIQAAGMAAAMPLPVYDDAVLVRDSITSAMDDASFLVSDAVYVSLQVLRARIHADITARLSRSARLLTYTPREPMSCLAMAYDLYEDVAREQEVIDRNAIRHPGFVPAAPNRVLSE
jgi:prophage DNA circulation protein